MELPNNIKSILIKLLPYIELCNETILHNKVRNKNIEFKGGYDYGRVIPKGKKCILWLKLNKNKQQSYIYELNSKTKQVLNVSSYNICYNKYLTNGKEGTILYGTLTNKTQTIKTNIFTIEDIIYYKGKNIQGYEWKNKLKYYSDLLNNIKQICYTEKDICCVIPYMFNKIDMNKINDLNDIYNVYSIQYLKGLKCYSGLYYEEQNRKRIFKVKAQLQNDIYDLYYMDGITKRENYLNIAYIPDYKTSVLLNSYFRKIKENINLDYLEMSDSEEEFENVSIDKFVDLNKSCLFECIYNNKFKMWIPVKYIEECNDNYIDKLTKLVINNQRTKNKIQ
jgi:hypothetical protein